MKRFLSIIVLVIVSVTFGYSQTATLTASCKYSKVAMNTAFQVTYTLKNGTAESFTKPSFKNFAVTGQYMSSGGGMTVIINGKKVESGDGESSWTYTLVPTAIGKFTIDAAKAKVNGTTISSNTLTIEVTASGSGTTSKSNSAGNTATTSSSNVSTSDIYIKATTDKTNPYLGEQIIVTYKLYTKVPVSQYNIDKLSSYTGFWSQEITKKDDDLVQYSETIDGEKYIVAELRKVALFPQKSGTLKINPLEVECLVQVKSKQQNDPFSALFNDPFFQNFNLGSSLFDTYSNQKKSISSNQLSIAVKPLPSSNQPADFGNSVGSFTLDSKIDKTTAKTNDAIKLTYTISGTGNIALIDKPTIEFPADLETYDPEETEKITALASGISGSKTFEYLIIPRNPGEFTIPSYTFSYFDLKSKTYKTLTSPEYKLTIAKGSGSDANNVTSTAKEDIKFLNSDIRYLKPAPLLFNKIGDYFYGTWLFFGILLLPFILFFIFIIIYRKRLEESRNASLMRNRKATSIAQKRLKKAFALLQLKNKDAFLDEVFKALWGYLGDKLNIPPALLSKETVSDALSAKNVENAISEEFIKTLNNCEYARFAPIDENVGLQSIYDEAIAIISKMERELK